VYSNIFKVRQDFYGENVNFCNRAFSSPV